jgi:hypothetical protein
MWKSRWLGHPARPSATNMVGCTGLPPAPEPERDERARPFMSRKSRLSRATNSTRLVVVRGRGRAPRGPSRLPRAADRTQEPTATASDLPFRGDLTTSGTIGIGVVHRLRSAVILLLVHAAAYRRRFGPRQSNSYAEGAEGSAWRECFRCSRGPSPPRKTKCLSLGTRSSDVHRG